MYTELGTGLHHMPPKQMCFVILRTNIPPKHGLPCQNLKYVFFCSIQNLDTSQTEIWYSPYKLIFPPDP